MWLALVGALAGVAAAVLLSGGDGARVAQSVLLSWSPFAPADRFAGRLRPAQRASAFLDFDVRADLSAHHDAADDDDGASKLPRLWGAVAPRSAAARSPVPEAGGWPFGGAGGDWAANAAAEKRGPALWTAREGARTPATVWKAFNRWDPKLEFLRAAHGGKGGAKGTVPNAQRHDGPVFVYYHSDRPFAAFVKRDPARYYEYVEGMETDAFVDAVLNRSRSEDSPYVYVACSVNDLAPELQRELWPLDALTLKNESYFRPANRKKHHEYRWTNVWIGPGGTTTPLHYDIMHNFFAQVVGAKRFLVFAPEAMPFLRLYPFLHPEGQLSQSPIEELLADPQLEPYIYDIVVNEGDILYLPPLWGHHVVALSEPASVSISVWGSSNETRRLNTAVRGPLPVPSSWPKTKILAAAKAFVASTLTRVLDADGGATAVANYTTEDDANQPAWRVFVRHLFRQRYSLLVVEEEPVVAVMKPTAPGFCDADLAGGVAADEALREELETKLASHVKRLTADMTSCDSLAVCHVWTWNWVEQVALTAVGDPATTARFLHDLAFCDEPGSDLFPNLE